MSGGRVRRRSSGNRVGGAWKVFFCTRSMLLLCVWLACAGRGLAQEAQLEDVGHGSGEAVHLTSEVRGAGIGGIDMQAVVLRGQPLGISVVLANRTAQRAQVLHRRVTEDARLAATQSRKGFRGEPFRPKESDVLALPQEGLGWLDYLRVEIVLLPPNGVDSAGADPVVWFSDTKLRSICVQQLKSVRQPARVAMSPIAVSFTIEPTETAAMGDGTYEVRVSLDTRACTEVGVWKGLVIAAPSRIAVRRVSGVRDRLVFHDTLMGHYGGSGEHEKVVEHASAIVNEVPRYREYIAYVYLGGALEQLDRRGEALQAYEAYAKHLADKRDVPIVRDIIRRAAQLRKEGVVSPGEH